jgi:hypothetical protein
VEDAGQALRGGARVGGRQPAQPLLQQLDGGQRGAVVAPIPQLLRVQRSTQQLRQRLGR